MERRSRLPRATVLVVLLALGLLLGGTGPAAAQEAEVSGAGDGAIEILLFHSETCPHCQAERAYLADLVEAIPEVTVTAYELNNHEDNRALLSVVAARMGFEPSGVPVTIFDDEVWIGFGPSVERELEARVVEAVRRADDATPIGPMPTAPPDEPDVDADDPDTMVAVPLVGDVDVGDHSLVVATLLIGFLDGVNPCSLWVLSLLLALVVHTGSRRRVFLVGAVFLTITTALYGLYMGGVYSILSFIAYVAWIRIGVAAIAGGMGVINLLDAFDVNLPFKLRIPEDSKPGIYKRMRAAARSEGSLAGTLGATAALAVGVSLIETPCTAGFPVMWSNLLASQDVGGGGAGLLFGLYMLVFLLDELFVFAVAVFTLRATKLQEEQGTLLKLAGGVVMITLAGVMILAPDLLESIPGTLAVFGGAAVVTVALGWWIRRGHRARPAAPAA